MILLYSELEEVVSYTAAAPMFWMDPWGANVEKWKYLALTF